MKTDSKIEFRDFNFWYEKKQILFDINLKIPSNKITALIGPSGCGKSTMLRAINRMNDLIPIARIGGNVFYNGESIYEKNSNPVCVRKKIGMVFQKPNPFPMTIFDNVAYGLRVQNGVFVDHIKQVVEDSLKEADLWKEVKDRLSLPAFRLSGGQQQRLCIARALAIKPDVLLLDEPCSALDPISTAKIEDLLKKLKQQHTIIIVTHNMQQAKRVSDCTCYLLNGKILEFGATKEIFSKPKNKLTRDYLNGEFG